MRKRLRKKKRIGEFREYMAEVRAQLAPETNIDAFLDDWILNAIESRQLQFGGSIGGPQRELTLDGIVQLGRHPGPAEHLAHLQSWLSQHQAVIAFEFGPITADSFS